MEKIKLRFILVYVCDKDSAPLQKEEISFELNPNESQELIFLRRILKEDKLQRKYFLSLHQYSLLEEEYVDFFKK